MKRSPLKRNLRKAILAAALAVFALHASALRAANITLTASDASNTSSFNSAGHWSNTQAPSSANTYQSSFVLRSIVSSTFAGSSLEILNGGILRIKNSGNTTTVNNLILASGGIAEFGSVGSATLAGSIMFPNGQAYLSGGTAGTGVLTVSSVLSGGGGFISTTPVTTGPGTTILTGANTYTGATTIAASAANPVVVQLGNANAVQNSTVTISLVDGLTFSTGIATFTIGALAGSVANTLANTTGAAVTLSVGKNNASTNFSGVLGGPGALHKSGTGTFTLSAANTYAGNTTISAGTLALGASGNLSAASNVSIAAGATFDVSAKPTYALGTNATLSASGSASAATLRGGPTVNLGSRPVVLTFNGSNAALALSTGTLQLTNNAFTVVVPGSALAAGSYILVTTPGAITGTPNATPSFAGGNGIVSGATAIISKSGNNVILTVSGGGSGPIPLINPSFETNTDGVVFTTKVSTGYDASNNVAGWLNAGTTYADSGVDYAGHAGITTQSGTVMAYCKAGDSGGYQISGYAMQSGDQLALTWWAKSSFGNASQVVSLLRATSTSSAFSTLTNVATSTAPLSQTGNGGAYTQYTLSYTATAADVGRFVAVRVTAAGPADGKWAVFDSFALSVLSGSGPGSAVAANSTVSPASASIVANGTSTQIITIKSRDANNMNLTTGGAAVVFSRTGGGMLSGTTDNGNGTYRATLTSPTSTGSATVTASLNGTAVGMAVGASQSVVTFTASGTVSPANSVVSPAAASIAANGTSTQLITVQARTPTNSNVTTGGATVVFSKTGGGTLSGTTDDGNGTYRATLTSPTGAGSATVTANLNGTAVGTAVGASQSVVSFTAVPLSAPNSTISPATASITANGTSTQIITVQARTSTNANVATGGATVVFSKTGGGTLSGTTDNGNGTYRASLTSPASAGSATVTANLNGTAVGTAVGASQSVVTFTAGGVASPANSTVSPGLASLTANGGSTQLITVQARNSGNGNVTTGGATVVISRTGTGTLSGTSDNGNGTYTATLTAPSAVGSATVTATLNGVAVGTAVSASQCMVTYYSNTIGDPLPALTAGELANFNAGSTAFAKVQDETTGLGPIFNNRSCAACHNFPVAGGSGSALVTRFGRTTGGVFDPLSSFGGSLLQDNSISTNPADFETVPPTANVSIRRSTTPIFGLGLLEAIPDSVIQANAALPNADGIVGTAAIVTDTVSGQQRVGHFGWKANIATLLTFTADAANNEVGMTNRFLPVGQSPNGNVTRYNQLNTVADPNDNIVSGKADIDRQAEFQRLLGPPPTLPLTANAIAGKALFSQIRCDICHTPTLNTAASFTPVSDLPQSPIAALSNKAVALYSDLLLHNMGPLADGVAQGAATTSQMKTPPLWGLRFSLPYMHDGRTGTVDGAIRAHAGEGLISANRYIALTAIQRAQLVEFLNSL